MSFIENVENKIKVSKVTMLITQLKMLIPNDSKKLIKFGKLQRLEERRAREAFTEKIIRRENELLIKKQFTSYFSILNF